MGGLNSKNGDDRRPSSSLHLRDKKELAGVGLIFRKSPDGFLVVKEVLGGSAADESGSIEAGDILTQVDDVKVAKASIADISAMVLGEPGQPVKLKFARQIGKSKKKFKVTLKRTVRATLEPTYHVQRDGINTKVTHIHLDCLQNQEDAAGAANEAQAAEARDVLDANGNVVGPGLLQKARMAAANSEPIPGVERLDASHPAWPSNSKKTKGVTRAGTVSNTKNMPVLKTKGSAPNVLADEATVPAQPARSQSAAELIEAPAHNPAAPSDPEPQAEPVSEPFAAAMTAPTPPIDNDLVGGSELQAEDLDVASMLDSFSAPAPAPVPAPAAPLPVDPPTIQADPEPIPSFEAPAPLAPEIKFDPPEPIPPPAPAEQPPVQEEEPPEEEDEELDFAGLAESRVMMFEAKSKVDEKKESKKVDLQKEWARSAAKAEVPAPEPAPAPAPAPVASKPEPVREAAAKEKEPAPAKPAAAEKPAASSWKKPEPEVVKPSPAKADKPEPKKMGSSKKMGGGGDLAAMMAARKKQMDENEDDGYYF